LAESVSPSEQRGIIGHAGANLIGGLGQFFLNNPATSLVVMGFGNDPVSGKKIVDPNASPMRQVGQRTKLLMQQFLPPLTPWVGRTADKLATSWRAPLSPKTGRGFREPGGFSTQALKAFFNVDARGAPTSTFDELLGAVAPGKERTVANDRDLIMTLSYRAAKELKDTAGYEPQQYMESENDYLRELYYTSIQDAASPAEKKKFEEELARQVSVQFGPVEAAKGMTGAQQKEKLRAMQQADPLDVYSRLPLDKKAAVLAAADAAQVNDESLSEMIIDMTTTERGIAVANDPDRVRRAIEVLRQRGEQEGANKRIGRLADHLRSVVLPIAEAQAKLREAHRVGQDAQKPAVEQMRKQLSTTLVPR
jgi:hypothetical protein